MLNTSRVKNFEELKVFQRSKELVLKVYHATREEPFRKDFGLTNQLQKACISVLSNIAEGYERGTNAELIYFLYISKGSCGEVRAQLIIAHELGYINEQTFLQLTTLCKTLSSMLWRFISYLKESKYKGPKIGKTNSP